MSTRWVERWHERWHEPWLDDRRRVSDGAIIDVDMPVHVITHKACLLHDNGPGHPERPARLETLHELFEDPALGVELARHEAPEASIEQLGLLHPPAYIEHVQQTALGGGGRLDADTTVIEASWPAALRAAGAGIHAVHLAFTTGEPVFAAVRPPGHHAEAAQAMGFCLFGNIALAAVEARQAGLAERVLIIDWDVHHGNGTQALVEHEPMIHFVSIHQWPLYPGTGRAEERGVGNVWNVPRPPGLAPQKYVDDLLAAIDSSLEDFKPELVLLSAGYDAMQGDPLAGFTLDAGHYAQVVAHVRQRLPEARLVAMLEGGYDLDNLRRGVEATLRALS